MTNYKVVLIENEVKQAILAILIDQHDLKNKEVIVYGKKKMQNAKTQALIMLLDGFKAANVSYYNSDYYFKDHKQAGIVIITDSSYKTIEDGLNELIELAKQELSIVEPETPAITLFNSPKKAEKPSLFADKVDSSLKTDVNGIITKTQYNKLKKANSEDIESITAIAMYEFVNK